MEVQIMEYIFKELKNKRGFPGQYDAETLHFKKLLPNTKQ
jgi:hypothetical protein